MGRKLRLRGAVFSAHAEVVPKATQVAQNDLGILRARGGSSGTDLLSILNRQYSPRTRR